MNCKFINHFQSVVWDTPKVKIDFPLVLFATFIAKRFSNIQSGKRVLLTNVLNIKNQRHSVFSDQHVLIQLIQYDNGPAGGYTMHGQTENIKLLTILLYAIIKSVAGLAKVKCSFPGEGGNPYFPPISYAFLYFKE